MAIGIGGLSKRMRQADFGEFLRITINIQLTLIPGIE